ncbi:Short-chain dehydrogenase cctT [Lachnellula suecica]|uniref:Short-chain dehydrogenase cctT n=1 Tax=Lachnellula suecica TaxID=602035 RepID=A0A8T9CC69_9HELO|nr:Short-chain dehydrogenase cctT [Lachnellula suecica]
MASSVKSVLITGCSAGGIGAALAEAFLGKGYHVFATVRNPSKISETLSTSEHATILMLDVLSPESINAAVENVKKETNGKLDVLVNNSGGGFVAPALDASIEEGKKLFDLNFWAPLAMLQAFAPLLVNSKGCVVNNSSANAFLPMPLMSIYNSSKAALAVGSETWRHELQPLGVRTITLSTCAVSTRFFNEYHAPELPETSYYYGIRDFIRHISSGSLQDKAISAEQYAKKVVLEVEKGTSGIVWAGTDAFMAHLGVALSPRPVLDMIVQSVVPLSTEMAKAERNKRV